MTSCVERALSRPGSAEAAASLRSSGCCVRCVLRLVGVFDTNIYVQPETALEAAVEKVLAKTVSAAADPAAAADDDDSAAATADASAATSESSSSPSSSSSSSSSSPPLAACIGCLGVMSDATARKLADTTIAKMNGAGYQVTDYVVTVSVPPNIMIRQFALSCMVQAEQQKAASSSTSSSKRKAFEHPNDASFMVDMSRIVKAMMQAPLAAAFPGACMDAESSLNVEVSFDHADRAAECLALPGPPDAKAAMRKRKRRDAAPSGGSLASARRALDALAAEAGQLARATGSPSRTAAQCIAKMRGVGLAVPPAPSATAAPCTTAVVVRRTSLFVSGNYRKYARGLSQTPWVVEGRRRGDTSVSEQIGGVINPIWGATEYKFHSAGREDIDVRMLGDGRPFVVELVDARRAGPGSVAAAATRNGKEETETAGAGAAGTVGAVGETGLAHAAAAGANAAGGAAKFPAVAVGELEEMINSGSTDVQVSHLRFVPGSVFQSLKDGADSKRKKYCCVVALSKAVSTKDLQEKLAVHRDLKIAQKTPVRVLHRRTQMVREKIVHDMECEYLNGRFFLLKLTTSAGMYVKEFVHGDLGRTQPNVGGLLGCEADILQLDVLDLVWDGDNPVVAAAVAAPPKKSKP